MPDYFLGLAISSIIGLIIGTIKPSLVTNRTRLFNLIFFFLLFIISVGIFGATAAVSSNAMFGLLGVFTIPLYIIIRRSKRKNKNTINLNAVDEADKEKIMSMDKDDLSISIPNTTAELGLVDKPPSDSHIKNSRIPFSLPSEKLDDLVTNYPVPLREPGTFNWYIMISFGKSTSQNYNKAVYLAKQNNKYEEHIDNGIITHTATYSDSRDDFLDFIILYDLVAGWKSTFFIINGEIVDKKTVGRLKYCYGDKCRSVKSDFCFGASYMTANPFGCHRLQVSLANNPWWQYYVPEGKHYRFDIDKLLERIKLTEEAFKYCPAFDIDYIIEVAKSFPLILTSEQYEYVLERANRLYINY